MKNITKEHAGENWKDWKWQQRNAVRDIRKLKDYFTNIPNDFFDSLYKSSGERLKFQVTPYMLSQIPKNIAQEDLEANPWFLQFFPLGKICTEGHGAYDGTDNWEKPRDFPTSNLQHKYTNRVLVRFRDCLAYCNFCFEALGILEKHPNPNKLFNWGDWPKSLEYISQNPDVEEVILSGGEPLLLSDSKLEKILKDINQIQDKDGRQKIRFKRMHTRALTHNPYRITGELTRIIADYHVNEIGLNVVHPSEITSEFIEAVEKIREGTGKHSPIIVTHTPLLKNINANKDTLWELFAKLYEINIKPYLLLHTIPHIPYADKQRVSVREGVRIMKSLKRHKSSIAIPEYTITQYDGKQTVPLELGGTPEFQYTKDEKGNPLIRFLNWKGNWVEYPDVEDVRAS